MSLVGDPEYHNGLLVVLLRDQHRLETVTGLGLEQVCHGSSTGNYKPSCAINDLLRNEQKKTFFW